MFEMLTRDEALDIAIRRLQIICGCVVVLALVLAGLTFVP